MNAKVVIFNETFVNAGNGYKLCFQYCQYEMGDGTKQLGYRFIYRKPVTENLIGARGQSRIPSIGIILQLLSQAMEAGWGHHSVSLKELQEKVIEVEEVEEIEED